MKKHSTAGIRIRESFTAVGQTELAGFVAENLVRSLEGTWSQNAFRELQDRRGTIGEYAARG
jgi:hypothetical protein